MKPGYGLELVQTQKLALTPELRQAIMVLQMGVQELAVFIREQAEENPLLDLVEEPQEEALPEPTDMTDEEWLAYFCDSSDLGMGIPVPPGPQAARPYDTLAEITVTLHEHLTSQLGLLDLSLKQREAGEFIIGNLDENGYLRCSAAEIALATGNSKAVVEEVLAVIQTFDPLGVGARDLRECLAIQARSCGEDGLVSGLIDSHLDDLAKGRYSKIAKDRRVTVDEVLSARDALLKMDPKPGASFTRDTVNYVCAEIRMKVDGDEVTVSFNESALPVLRWNSFYRSLLPACDQDAKQYLIHEMRKARVLLHNIQQRKDTIVKVMGRVVARQGQFFRLGPGHLRPLTMKEVATELGIHESTVSRCVSNKYVETPYGIYPCKAFFSPRASATSGTASQESVKKAIQDLVQSEDRANPLADQDICMELSKQGMAVARRTVSKYRVQLGIQPSGRRKSI